MSAKTSKNLSVAGSNRKNNSNYEFTIDKPLIKKLSIVLILVSFFLYLNTLNHGYVLDDHSVIRENTLTKGGTSSIKEIFSSGYRDGFGTNGNDLYRPLSKVMFAIEWEYAPNNPKVSHFINIFLYSLTCFLLFIVLLRFIKVNVYVLFVASLLFTVHPIHTEVVANIKSRDEILALLFLLLSLLLISKYLSTTKISNLIGSLTCFFLALLSKESAIVFVGIVFLVIHFFSELPLKKNIIITSIFTGVALIYILIHLKIIGNLGIPNIPVVDNSLMGTESAFERKLTAFYILGKYLLLLFVPYQLSCDYSYSTIPIITSPANFGFLLSFAIHAFLAWFAIKKFKEKNILSFSILFYAVTISLTSNLVFTIGTNMAERLMYMPTIGFCLAIAYAGAQFFKIDLNSSLTKANELLKENKTMTFLVILICVIFSFKTISRNKDWLSDGTLFEKDIEKVPNSAHMLFYTANHLTNKDSLKLPDREIRLAKADKYIKKALTIYEQFPDAHNVNGKVNYELKRFDDALASYKRALELNPTEVMNHNNIGTCYFNTGKLDEAVVNFTKATELNPKDADARCNLGSAYGAMGETYKSNKDFENAKKMFDLAITHFNKTIEIDPNYKSAYQFIGITYNNLGDTLNGRKYLEAAAKIQSN